MRRGGTHVRKFSVSSRKIAFLINSNHKCNCEISFDVAVRIYVCRKMPSMVPIAIAVA
jgi:hypothetical protein